MEQNADKGQGAFFIDNIEYRPLESENGVYEYNRMNKSSSLSFSEGGLPDGYVVLDENGSLRKPPISYALLDQYIGRDSIFLGSLSKVPLTKRDYRYYCKAENILRSIERVKISADGKEVVLLSNGRKFKINFVKSMEIADRSQGKFFPFVDIRLGGEVYSGVELKPEPEECLLFVVDHSVQGWREKVPFISMMDGNTGRYLCAAGSNMGGKGHMEVKTEKGSTFISPYNNFNIKNEKKGAGLERHAQIYADNVLPDLKKSRSVQKPKKLGSNISIISETDLGGGKVERVAELGGGKVRFTLLYEKDGRVRVGSISSGDFIYPGAVLAGDWEKKVSRFGGGIDEASLKREVIAKARELISYQKIVYSMPEDIPEYSAVAAAMRSIVADMEKKYGHIFRVVDAADQKLNAMR